MSANVTAFDQLILELEKGKPDFENVRQIISAHKRLLNKPIDNDGKYVLHYACWKKAPSNIVIEFINDNPLAVQQKDNNGRYPLHYACWRDQSESVIQLLIKEYPMAVQQKTNYYGWYPLHLACANNQSESVIQLLVEEYPLAIQQKDIFGYYPLHYACQCHQSESIIQLLIKEYPLAVQQQENGDNYPLQLAIRSKQCENVVLKLIDLFPEATAYGTYEEDEYDREIHENVLVPVEDPLYPLHFACRYSQSEKVLLVLINLCLRAVKKKHKDDRNKTPLCIAKKYNQSSTIIKVLEELTKMSDYDLENRVGIPTIVTLHGMDNLRRNDIFQWILHNSPILMMEYMNLD